MANKNSNLASDTKIPTGQVLIQVAKPPWISPPPTAANFFHFSWSNLEVQMLAGYLDMVPPADGKSQVRVVPEISSRTVMSVRGFATLRAQIEEATDNLRAMGIPIDEMTSSLRNQGHV